MNRAAYSPLVAAEGFRERPDAAAAIARTIRARLPELVDDIVDHIRSEIASYADGGFVSVEEHRTALWSNVTFFLDRLEGIGASDLVAPTATGRTRAARGLPLVDLLAASRLGFADLWAAVVGAARSLSTVSADDVVELAGVVFALQNEYSDAVVSAYRDEAQQLTRSSERERAALAELIVSDQVPAGTLWEAAQTLRLPVSGTFLVVAAEVHELGHDPLPKAESALAVLDVGSVWRLEADLSVGVLSLPGRSRVDGVLRLLDRHAAAHVGVSPVFVELGRAPWALRLARLALGAQQDSTGVRQFEDTPLNLLVAAAPGAALETVHAVLGGLLAMPAGDRDLLLRTFGTWLEAGGSATAAGVQLFCHPNTVRYRLRRVEAVTGRSLGDPRDLTELVAALRAWNQLPPVGRR